MPSELIIDLKGGVSGQAQLRAGEWIEFESADLRIVPVRGDVHYNSEDGSFKIEIILAALRIKPPEPQIIIPP